MFFDSKEKKVERLLYQFLDAVEETLKKFKTTFEYYFENKSMFDEMAFHVHEAEHTADGIKRKIEVLLYEGAFLSIFRGDYTQVIELIDKVANTAESVSDFLVIERPVFPKTIIPQLKKIIDEVVNTFVPLRELIRCFNKDMKGVLKCVEKVNDQEQEVDKLEWELLKDLFALDIELAQKIQVKTYITMTAKVSDLIEDVADRFGAMVIKHHV